jgi:hypothetical protein
VVAVTLHHKWGERRMTCPEYQQLLHVYEAALRRWEQTMWSSKADAPGKPDRLPSEMKQRAYLERNDAHEQMHAHKQSCSVCKSRLRVVPEQ